MTGRGGVQGGPGGAGIVAAGLALLFALRLAVVLWGVNRGFDLGDGGFFLLNLNHPAESPPLFAFYKLLLWFEPPLRIGPIGARLLRIATELAGTLVLAHAVFRWAQVRMPDAVRDGFAFLLGFGLLGSLLSVAAREFGYNDVTNLLTFSACACLFRLLALEPGAPGRAVWAAGAGFLLGLQLFVKFPAALLLVALTALLVPVAGRSTLREGGRILACHVLGLAAAVGLFVTASGGIAPLRAAWTLATEVNRVTGYGVAEVLRVYVFNDWGSHVNLLRFAGAFAALLGGSYLLPGARGRRLDRALAIALVGGCGVLVLGAFTFHAVNVHPWLLVLYGSLLLLSVVSWLRVFGPWTASPRPADCSVRQTGLPLGLLAVLPFVAIVGTNVALTLRLPSHAFPLFLLLGLLTSRLRRSGQPAFSAAALGVLALASSLVFVSHHVERPYGLAAPLYRQDQATPGLPGLRVDRATGTFLETLQSRMAQAGLQAGDPLIAFDFMPGLVYFLGARAPGFPFLPFDRPQQSCWAVNRAAGGEVPFLILGQDMSLEERACIRTFDFPGDFVSLGALRNPYEEAVPYFFGGPAIPYVQLFAPAR